MAFGQYSMYKKTGSTNGLRNLYNPIEIPRDPETDTIITISSNYAHKPGLLAYDLYGTARLNWIFIYYNRDKIKDNIWDLKEGLEIVIPEKNRLLKFF